MVSQHPSRILRPAAFAAGFRADTYAIGSAQVLAVKFEFAAQSTQDSDNRWPASSRLINMYREPIGDRIVIKPVLGTIIFGDLPGVFCRAMAEVDGKLYVVHGERLYRVEQNGLAVDLGTIPDDENTTISGNNGKVTVCAGGNYYVWNGTTLTEPTPGAFSEFGSVTFYKQLTVLTELGGRRVQWSDPAAPATLDGLSFATAETTDADIICAIPVGAALWVFKEKSIETWASYSDGTLAAIPGSTIEPGLKAFSLLTEIPGGLFFIGSDNVPYLYRNGGMQEIPSAAVKTSITKESPTGVVYYEDEGHKFCAITFDRRPAWVFDIVTGEWHERAEGNTLSSWSVQAVAKAYGNYIAGTKSGPLVRFARVGQDLGRPMIKRAVGRSFHGDLDRFRVHEFLLPITVGGAGAEEMVRLRTSGDHGFTWSDPMARGLGPVGQYSRRVMWTRLGQFEQFTAEITYSGAADITFDSTVDARAS
jgi:hypothetical protein